MSIIDDIKYKIEESLAPENLSVTDDSASHYGHDGASPGTVSHVAIKVVSKAFEGKNRIDRQRLVYRAIAEETPKIHAITVLTTVTPSESIA